ncbi:MAG: acylneuraminate cytidylyltransferase family protein [Mobilitalea sp.]
MKNIAIIPARSGSKGLKDKNIKLLNHKPLLAYSIEAAKNSRLFDEIYVSTDSEKYAEIAKEHGAEIPFLRSAETATDSASSWDVVKEALARYEQMGKTFDMVTLLQPTTPLRTEEDIRKAYDLYSKRNANAVVGVCEVDHSPLWCNTLPEDQSLCGFINPEVSNKPRQKLDTFYRINGAIYMVNIKYLMECTNIYASNCIAYIMEKQHSVDIDDEFDFKVAEMLMN